MNNLEEELKLPKNFFLKLLEEDDDWSFIIKLHALIEGAVSYLLTKTINEKCSDIFAQLELSNNKTGKIAFAGKAGLLDDKEISYIKKLSEIRNKLIHNISDVKFDLKAYVAELDNQQIKSMSKCFAPFGPADDISLEDFENAIKESLLGAPRLFIWLGAGFVLNSIYLNKEIAKSNNLLKKFRFLILDNHTNN